MNGKNRCRVAVGGAGGEITFGCLFMIAVVVVGGYLGYMFGRPYYYNSVFEERLYEMAEHVFHQSRSEVMKYIITTGLENNIQISEKNISYRETSTEVTIEVRYDVPVTTPIYSRTLKFVVHVNRNFSR